MDRSFIHALLAFRQEARSGVLEVRADGLRTFLYLAAGHLVFAEEETVGETLGRLLVRQRKLTQEQYIAVIKRMTDGLIDNEQLRFGEVAVELGFLTKDETLRALADQVRWKVVRLFQRSTHEFAFRESSAEAHVSVHYPLVLETMILEACRWVEAERNARVVESVPAEAIVSLREPVALTARRFGVTSDEQRLLELMDGTRSMGTLAKTAQSGSGDALPLLSALVTAYALRLTAPAARPPAAPATPPEAFAPPPLPPAPPTPLPNVGVAAAASTKVAPPAAAAVSTPQMQVATPAQFVPFKGADAAAAKERADRALAMLRQQKGARAAGPSVAQPAPAAEPAAPRTEHEARLLAEQAFQRGRKHLAGDRPDLALVDFQKARDLQPDSGEYELFARWAELVVGPNDLEAARVALKRCANAAAKADPNLAFAYFVLGEMALVEKNETLAIKALSHALRLDPQLGAAQRRLRLLRK